MKTAYLSIVALCCLASSSIASIQFTQAVRSTDLIALDLISGQNTLLESASNIQPQGHWESLVGRNPGGFAYQRSTIGTNFISIFMEANDERIIDETTGHQVVIWGAVYFSAKFEITESIIPYFIFDSNSYGFDRISLVQISPQPGSIGFSFESTGVYPTLTPGVYEVVGGHSNYGASGGTLILPSPGALALLAPLSLYATRRRR